MRYSLVPLASRLSHQVTPTAWEIRCAGNEGLGGTSGICSRERDRRLGDGALNNGTEGNGGGVGGPEAEGDG
jgi:hypothetical protein